MPDREITTPGEGHEQISLGAGCFWCVEAVLKQVDGVLGVTSGYQGGHTENPTYQEICTGTTNHAEVVHVVYDPEKLTTDQLLDWFWRLHDPTQLNRQGNDIGTQYRSVIFYYTDDQKAVAEASMKAAQAHFDQPIVTQIVKAPEFYPAEVSHQDYYELNKNKNPYCRAVITPKLEKLGLEK
ncbi:peptide-methionine (S)-S-oxide reductase MsrA [Sulfuriroseicoccus oceanibius]|uniref:Peptide methionine sulfoxide reductase MsrA n=2 Tax=Sulfuriroseicoccus oceanibius TaxID=2707525 RepID=A0A6B3LEC5_9BACT|nr:peptide-methionine (S)-S-oxide reductase MsrA [Sulfuriroseicoccus oceanibius]